MVAVANTTMHHVPIHVSSHALTYFKAKVQYCMSAPVDVGKCPMCSYVFLPKLEYLSVPLITLSYGFINVALSDVNGNKMATVNANAHPNEHHKQKHVNALTLCLPTQFCKNGQWWSKSTMHLLHVEQ